MAAGPPPPPPAVASHVVLDAAAFGHNVGVFRRVVGPGVRVAAVVKGNAYGHGFDEVLPLLHPHVDAFDVVTPGEALAIRAAEARNGWSRRAVLVIGPVDATEVVDLAEAGVDVVVADPRARRWERALADAGRRLRVHVHVDSGLGREGWAPAAVGDAVAFLRDAPHLDVVGVLTHFADTEDVTEQTYARRQLRAFEQGVSALQARLAAWGRPTALERHAAASAAALVLPESRFDTVRVGISAYGIWPSRETRLSVRSLREELPVLRPALSWRVPALLVKELPAGSFVGYGCTHRCRDATRIAVFPVGYHDGYPRRVSHRAHVLVGGQRCPVLGRVMMNLIVADVTGVAELGDAPVATLLGRDGDEWVRAEDLAGWADTIAYEILTRIGAHLRREVVPDGSVR